MSALTKVYRTNADLRALVLGLLPSISWRHHGIGVLQGYVSEDAEPEVRIHVWAPELVKPGMEHSGDVHDHRFDLVSHVLVGTVAHEEWFAEPGDHGAWSMLRLTHARAAADTNYHGPTEPLPGRFHVRQNLIVVPAGHTYTFPAGHFHRSPVFGLAVTVVEKHRQQPVSARLLYPHDTEPVMAFGHEMNAALIASVVHRAMDALRAHTKGTP